MYDGVYLIINLLLTYCLLWFVYGPYQDIMINTGRQRLFVIRDEIFDMALNGELDFSDPRYRQIRTSIEMMIRQMHSLTIGQFVVLQFCPKTSLSGSSPMESAIESFEDDQLKEKLRGYQREVARYVIGTAVLRSPVFILLLIPTLIYLFCTGRLFERLSRLKSQIESSDNHGGPDHNGGIAVPI